MCLTLPESLRLEKLVSANILGLEFSYISLDWDKKRLACPLSHVKVFIHYETNKYVSLYWENKEILKCRLTFQFFLTRSDFSSGGSGREQIRCFQVHLFLFHLIRDHLQPGDEVPVDDCALLALVLEEPFSVMSYIVPFAVLLTLKSSLRLWWLKVFR